MSQKITIMLDDGSARKLRKFSLTFVLANFLWAISLFCGYVAGWTIVLFNALGRKMTPKFLFKRFY